MKTFLKTLWLSLGYYLIALPITGIISMETAIIISKYIYDEDNTSLFNMIYMIALATWLVFVLLRIAYCHIKEIQEDEKRRQKYLEEERERHSNSTI